MFYFFLYPAKGVGTQERAQIYGKEACTHGKKAHTSGKGIRGSGSIPRIETLNSEIRNMVTNNRATTRSHVWHNVEDIIIEII